MGIRRFTAAFAEGLNGVHYGRGRTAFYDSYGVVRDVMQNHLTEMLAFVAMDLPPRHGRTMAEFLAAKAEFLQQVRITSRPFLFDDPPFPLRSARPRAPRRFWGSTPTTPRTCAKTTQTVRKVTSRCCLFAQHNVWRGGQNRTARRARRRRWARASCTSTTRAGAACRFSSPPASRRRRAART